jgi:DNA-binding NtrC family response regulator/tetratricopeptide (TPR) repeat protein
VRDHIAQAASALHAAGDLRHLALVHSLSGVTLAQDGRLDEAMGALRHAERLALMVHAGDVVAIVCGNQANVAMMQHRHEQAMSLAERSVELQEEAGTPHGLGIALASLGQICVRLGNLTRAEEALNRALDVRSPMQFMRETTGAVFDTLAQIYLTRGNHEEASRCLQRSREAYGEYGAQTSRWYQWSVRVLEARVALRRGDASRALEIANEIARAQDVPAGYATQADLVAVEALLVSRRQQEAEDLLGTLASRLEASGVSGIWGEFLRQGFELCSARDRPLEPAAGAIERQLEPLIPGFVCASAAMQRVTDQIQRLQGNDLTVLITGESGTGKDLVARAIHAGSPRRSAMFLPYNCTSATRELADSQLFGHRRGSFTGAVADQPGVLRTAVGGTLFLDEVGDLPIDVQPKLLRFLEQGEVLPVGETRPTRVDVRVVAATNADLEHRVSDGKFREDLFYRLSVIRIHVPPLRDRREEIPHLSTFFLREASERLGKPGIRLSPDTLDLFDAFSWPGNVRQLRNEVQRAVAMAGGSVITPDLLSPMFGGAGMAAEGSGRGRARSVTLSEAVDRLERDMIETALGRAAGNISQTARSLGLTRRGLYLKMDRLGIPSAVRVGV